MKQHPRYYGSPRRKREKKRIEILFLKIMVENFQNLGRDMTMQVHEVQRFPKKILQKEIIIKLSKI